jgi:hypothetical protein
LLLFRRNILRRRGSAFAKKVLLHLADDHFLVFSASRIETIFIEEHFAEFGPLVPGLLGDIVVNLAPEIRIKGRLVEAGKFFVQLDAVNPVLHDGHSRAKIISQRQPGSGAQ